MLKRFVQKVSNMKGPFLLAVSGGVDSMCLAHLFLKAMGPECFSVAHCNFSLRGDESDGDEALVRRWTEEHGVRLHVTRFDTKSFAASEGISIEMAARDLRYGWFADLCREYGYKVLAVAHNANDNAETLLLNLLRGTGMNGLACMSEMSMLPCSDAPDVVLYRPMLEFTRKQIEGYAFAERIEYRNDSTNFSSEYRRNTLRNDVFPFFEKINPSFVRTLNRDISYFTAASDIVERWCCEAAEGVVDESGTVISVSRLKARTHWKYLLYYILSPFGFNSQSLESLEALLSSERTLSGKRFESATHVLITGRDSLNIFPRNDERPATSQSEPIMTIRAAGKYFFNGQSFEVDVIPWTSDMPLKQPDGVIVMDADSLRFPFVCRRWRQGDWLIPLGMKGKKKVSDLFADLKYDFRAKEEAIVIVDVQTPGLAEKQHVSGLLGARIDDRCKIGPDTYKVIKITLS